MNIVTKFAFTTILNATLVAFVSSILFGWNKFVGTMGGTESLLGLIALAIMGAVIIGGAAYLMVHDYINEETGIIWFVFLRDLAITTIIVVILAGVGFSWLSLPNGAGVKVLICLILITVISGAQVAIGRHEEV